MCGHKSFLVRGILGKKLKCESVGPKRDNIMLGRSGHDTPTKAKGDQIKCLKVFANSENETSDNTCKIVNLYNVLERKTTQMSLV